MSERIPGRIGHGRRIRRYPPQRIRHGRRIRRIPPQRIRHGRRIRRILYVHSRKASFVAIDRAILAEEYEVEDLYQPGRVPNPLRIVPAVARADLVFGWFASWHTFLPITLAWLLR